MRLNSNLTMFLVNPLQSISGTKCRIKPTDIYVYDQPQHIDKDPSSLSCRTELTRKNIFDGVRRFFPSLLFHLRACKLHKKNKTSITRICQSNIYIQFLNRARFKEIDFVSSKYTLLSCSTILVACLEAICSLKIIRADQASKQNLFFCLYLLSLIHI